MAQPNTNLIRQERTTVATIALVLSALIVAAIVRFSFLSAPFDADGALFVYMGKMVDEGGRFGVDLIDNKPPTVGLMTSIVWRAFGGEWCGYVATSAVMSVIASLAIARAVNWARPGRFASAFALALVLLNIQPFVFGGFQTETLQMSFAALACAMGVAALTKQDWRDALAAGLCAGCAAMFKPSGLAIVAALAISFVVAFRFRSVWLLLSMTSGVAIVAAVASIYLDKSRSFDYFVNQTREAAGYAAHSAIDGFAIFKLATVVGAILAVIGLTTFFGRRTDREVAPGTCLRSIVLLGVAWLLIETIGVALQRRMYAYHFLPMFAPAALLVALLPRMLSAKVILVAWILPLALSFDQTRALYEQKPDDRHALSDYLERHAHSNDRVWIDGYARLLIETNLKPGSRLPLTFLFINDDTAPLRYTKLLLNDLETNRTRYVVLPANFERNVKHHIEHNRELAAFETRRENYVKAWDQLEQRIRTDYLFETRIDGLDVYIRRPASELEMDRADLADFPF
ncbi:MAG TPA: glycosyltransferase family 39 protein [Tepidisphaeraceae bacterium]|nr:glycosyltransferase family 39 protein [Tepidisphaeraceae bacterium]